MTETLSKDVHEMVPTDEVSDELWRDFEANNGNEAYSVAEIVEGLSDSDREIVANEATARVEDYAAVIGAVESQTAKLEAAPARVSEATKAQGEKFLSDLDKQVETDLALDYTSREASTLTFLKDDIAKVRHLQSTLQQVREGARLKALNLNDLEVATPKRSLPSTKRQAVEAQLAAHIHQAQQHILESVGVRSDDDLYKLAVNRTAYKVSVEQAAAYADGTTETYAAETVDKYDPKLLVAAAAGVLDKDRAQQAFDSSFSRRVSGQVDSRAYSAMERVSVRHAYSDHTLAGQEARKEISEKRYG